MSVDVDPSRFYRRENTILMVQLATLGLVSHLWFDMMGEPQTGARIAALFIALYVVLYFTLLQH